MSSTTASSSRTPIHLSDSVRRLARGRAARGGAADDEGYYAFKYSLLPSSLQQASSSQHQGVLTSSGSNDLSLEYPPRSSGSNAHVFTSSEVTEHPTNGEHTLLLLWDDEAGAYRLEAVAASVAWKYDRSRTALSERARRLLTQQRAAGEGGEEDTRASKRRRQSVRVDEGELAIDTSAATAAPATSSPMIAGRSSSDSPTVTKAPATRASRRLSARTNTLNDEEVAAAAAPSGVVEEAATPAAATPPPAAVPSPASNGTPRSTWQPPKTGSLAATSLAYDDDDDDEDSDDEDEDEEEGDDGDDLADFARELEEGMAGE